MKKLLLVASLIGLTSMATFGQSFQARQFVAPGITTFMVTNAAAAPLGGYTNLLSPINLATNILVTNAAAWSFNNTNTIKQTWTNSQGIWVIPTNGVIAATNPVGIMFVTNNTTPLTVDVSLYSDRNGQGIWGVVSNDTRTFQGNQTISCTTWGDASAATTLNFIFVGLPDGQNEVTGANGTPQTWQWGYVPAPGLTTSVTNFPSYLFAGCSKVRLRSATLTTTTAANIGVSIKSLTLNGFVP